MPKYFSESILELRTTLWAPQTMEAGGNFHNRAVLYPNAPLFSRSRWAVYEHESLLTYDLWVNVISPILTGDSYKYESLGKQARDTKRKAEASKLKNSRQNRKNASLRRVSLNEE